MVTFSLKKYLKLTEKKKKKSVPYHTKLCGQWKHGISRSILDPRLEVQGSMQWDLKILPAASGFWILITNNSSNGHFYFFQQGNVWTALTSCTKCSYQTVTPVKPLRNGRWTTLWLYEDDCEFGGRHGDWMWTHLLINTCQSPPVLKLTNAQIKLNRQLQ